jgi:hypothetical protein
MGTPKADAVEAKRKAWELLAQGAHPVEVGRAVGRSTKTVKGWAAEMAAATDDVLVGAVVEGAELTREILVQTGPAAARLLDDIVNDRVDVPVDRNGRADAAVLNVRASVAKWVAERFMPALSEKTVSGHVTVSGDAALEKLRPLLEAPDDDGES